MRRRSSARSSSGTSTRKGRTVVWSDMGSSHSLDRCGATSDVALIISWQIDRLGGSSSPPLPITPSPPEWRALAGSTVGMHRRSEPHQERVPARSHVVEHLPTWTRAAGPAQLEPLEVVIGGELDPSEIIGEGPR